MNSLFIPLYMQNYECLKIIKSEDWLENFHSCQFDPLVNSQGAVASRVVLLEDGLVLLLHTDTDLSTNKQTNTTHLSRSGQPMLLGSHHQLEHHVGEL